ncbi:alpha/beta hydrolase [Nonomuraea glycinis]|uniref:Alpha/beta hydrolase n=1 Tax=Nonomuraea glycinis TaxID=2047744 RepID=A0A918E4W6_9ACTN|nr:alpha/beta hydrolase [Nonomuraea glycinis]MCA2180488.1 alpha/beta hydrolase [Nonomuraea glycinis]GGP04265.1 alpha/beta hydrolase [Nonomuraea glycinis]
MADVYLESDGDGPAVLFLHGSGASGAVWKPVLAELRERGTRCRRLVADLPGHGRSGHRQDYSPEGYADAVAAALTGVQDPVTVVGHSLGGMIGMALADGTRGLTVVSLAVVAMKVAWTEEELTRRAVGAGRPVRVFADQEQARELFGRVSGMTGPAFTDEDRGSGVTARDDGYGLSGDPGIAKSGPATGPELAARMRRVTCPVELACGDHDPGIKPADMAEVLGHPVTVLPGAGHNVHIERPDLIADLVERALDR